jgi:hypothetical protein
MVVRMDVGAQEIDGQDRKSVPRQTSAFDSNKYGVEYSVDIVSIDYEASN